MKQFNQEFKTKLWDTIAEIENNSLVEVVVSIKPQSESYTDIAYLWGAISSFITFSLFMFLPTPFNDYLIYTGTIFAFFVGAFIALYIKPMQNLLLKKSRKERSVEIMGRALFQKGGIRHTNEKIGLLILVSLFEKMVYLVPDRGVETAIPTEIMEQMNIDFQDIFNKKDIPQALIDSLAKQKEHFNRYIPPIENDINELPDNMEIKL